MASDEPESIVSSKYKIVRLLGAGGMGSVYLARDLTLNRDVAIKFVALSKIGDATARRRLLREAQAAAALDHPLICGVHEVGTASDGRPYIVMQFVEGETLGEHLRRSPMDPRAAIALAADIAEALRAAHAHGIVHRDLKPHNIILTASGRPKLLDFGIAHLLHPQPLTLGNEEETRTDLTGQDHVIGTPGYMSPEQLQHGAIDGRSDLFSLGAVLHECLTGRPAFKGRSPIEIGAQVLHADPAPVSSIRPELTERHDEIVSKLLAKEPEHRFQSAEEVLGALRVFSTGGTHKVTPAPSPARRFRIPAWAFALLGLLVLATGTWVWWRGGSAPEPTAEARRWYQRGTESIRDGAYYSGRLALEEAIRLFPAYPQAYARLAEAQNELDEERDAQNALLRVRGSADRTRLGPDDRLTIDAIKAIVLRDLDVGIAAYRRLADRRSNEAGVWLDLGRAQEAASRGADARRSYERATQIDSQYAAAYLRLGSLDALEGRSAEARAAMENAERLYKTASNHEGETEALLRRGSFLNDTGDVPAARSTLEHARTLASGMGSRYHEIRAQLQLAAVTASEGRLRDAELLAASAVEAARDAELETVAAEGLIELGTALQLKRELDAAQIQLTRAIAVSDERGAKRLAARARLQASSLLLAQNKPADALKLAEGQLGFVRAQKYRRLELTALNLISRARNDLGQFEDARATVQQVLAIAEEIQDETQIGNALENLAGPSLTHGLLPDALRFRDRAEEIHRRQGNEYSLSFDLTNRAELLIRLGRGETAEALLREVEAGIAKKIEAYVGRSRRVKLLRTLRATIDLRFEEAARLGMDVGPSAPNTGSAPDATGLLASALADHARLRSRKMSRYPEPSPVPSSVSLATSREIRYWRIAAFKASGASARALADVSELLEHLSAAQSDELEWRVAAMGAAAARQAGLPDRARDFAERARKAWQRLEASWPADISIYAARPDIVELRRDAGIDGPLPRKGTP